MKAMRLLRCTAVMVAGACAVSVFEGSSASAESSAADAMKAVDTDKDGTISLNEAKSAATAVIVKIDADHNGILNNKELGGRVTVLDKLMPSPNPYMSWKSEGTITKEEYLSLVEGRFKSADPDNDGTLDAKELGTETGQLLLKLLQ
jgi:Ca2+-binding EF-hand superfamily protein